MQMRNFSAVPVALSNECTIGRIEVRYAVIDGMLCVLWRHSAANPDVGWAVPQLLGFWNEVRGRAGLPPLAAALSDEELRRTEKKISSL